MPKVNPFHQLLLRKAVALRFKDDASYQLKGSDVRHLAEHELMLSYNTLRKLFLKPAGSINFQEYILNKLIWYIFYQYQEFDNQKHASLWHEFEKTHPTPDFGTPLPESHFNLLPESQQEKIRQSVAQTLQKWQEQGDEVHPFDTKRAENKQQAEEILLPLAGLYAYYRTGYQNQRIEKRYAKVFRQNQTIVFELKTALFEYKNLQIEFRYPALFLLFDNGQSKLVFNLYLSDLRQNQVLMGTFSHFSVSKSKPDAGIVVFVRQNTTETDFEKLEPKSIAPDEKLPEGEEKIIQDYFSALPCATIAPATANSLKEITALTAQLQALAGKNKDLDLVQKFYVGAYILFAQDPKNPGFLLKTPARLCIGSTNELIFELSGRNYQFESLKIEMRKNFLYIEINNIYFGDKGFYVFDLPQSTQPTYIQGIGTFINAQNQPTAQKVLLHKQAQEVSFESLENERVEKKDAPQPVRRFFGSESNHLNFS